MWEQTSDSRSASFAAPIAPTRNSACVEGSQWEEIKGGDQVALNGRDLKGSLAEVCSIQSVHTMTAKQASAERGGLGRQVHTTRGVEHARASCTKARVKGELAEWPGAWTTDQILNWSAQCGGRVAPIAPEVHAKTARFSSIWYLVSSLHENRQVPWVIHAGFDGGTMWQISDQQFLLYSGME